MVTTFGRSIPSPYSYRPLRYTQTGHPRWAGAMSTGDGFGHRWKIKRVSRSSGSWYQQCWHTGLLYSSLIGYNCRSSKVKVDKLRRNGPCGLCVNYRHFSVPDVQFQCTRTMTMKGIIRVSVTHLIRHCLLLLLKLLHIMVQENVRNSIKT